MTLDRTLLPLLAQLRSRCACSDATRVHLGGLEIPVGPVTVIFAVVALLFAGPLLAGQVARRREARAMRRALEAE